MKRDNSAKSVGELCKVIHETRRFQLQGNAHLVKSEKFQAKLEAAEAREKSK
jgi:hypothetical protein